MFECGTCGVVWSKFRRLFKQRSKVAYKTCSDCVKYEAWQRAQKDARDESRKTNKSRRPTDKLSA